MRRRLLLLLAVACLSGTVAGFVSTARAGKQVAAPRIPALPRVAPTGRSFLGALCPPSGFGAGRFTVVHPTCCAAGAAAGTAKAAVSARSASLTNSR